MRFWARLATLCLSVVLLGGVLLHDTASAAMSFEMAASDMVSAAGDDGNCPACAENDAGEVVCDLDCTAPVLSTAVTPQALSGALRGSCLVARPGISLRNLDLGVDPTPPRSHILI